MSGRGWMVRAAAAAALIPLAVAAGGGRAAAQRFAVGGSRVAFYNLAGEVRVEPGTGADVVVEVTRGGSDAGDLRVERARTGDYDAVRVVYPDRRIIYERGGRMSTTTVRVRGDGSFGGGWRGGDGREYTVAGWGSGTHAWADARVLVPAGRTVAIHQAVGSVMVANVNGELRVRTASARVSTRDTRGTLDVDVGSGGVEVDGADGRVKVDAGSGGVRVARVHGAELNVDTGSGGVAGADVEVGALAVDVGSGGVTLDNVRAAEVKVDAGSGSVRLGLRGDARSVRLESGSGGIHLAVPESFGARVSIDTGSGGIRLGVPVQARRSSRSHLEGTIGDGNGTLSIETGSGGVTLERS